MKNDLIFYTNPMSRGRVARWMLEEVGASYETQILEYGTTMKAPEYLAINPMGKVPALRHGDSVVTECAAICAYLADAFPHANLAPKLNDPLRGAYYRWLFFAAGPLEAAVANKMLEVKVPPERKGMVGYGSFEEVLSAFESAMAKGPYLVGNQFSAADLYVSAQFGWLMEFGVIEKRPVFEDYVKRFRSRPAAIKAAKMDDELMKK